MDAGELSPRTWARLQGGVRCDRGRSSASAGWWPTSAPTTSPRCANKLAKKWGPHRLGKTIQFIRCVFKYAYDADLIDRPVRFGPGFKRPSKKTLRLHRAKQGPKLFTADEIRRLLDAAGVQLKAMILLGINCGFGNADCGNLPLPPWTWTRG